MDVFEYVAVMVTVVLALGLSHILTCVAAMLSNRERVRPYWVLLVWAFSLLALHLQAWLVLWSRRDQERFPVIQVTMMLVAAAFIFVSARILVPEIRSDRSVDLREHFFRIRVPLFATLSVFWLFPIVGRLMFASGTYGEATMLVRFSLMGLSVSGLLIRDARWQSVLAVLWFTLLVSHMALVGPHLARAAA